AWRAAILWAAAVMTRSRPLPITPLPYNKAQSDVRPEESHHRDRAVGGDPARVPAAGRGTEAGPVAPAAGGAADRAASQHPPGHGAGAGPGGLAFRKSAAIAEPRAAGERSRQSREGAGRSAAPADRRQAAGRLAEPDRRPDRRH